MQTNEHKQHISLRVSHNDCQECRADCERQFLRPQWPKYEYVADYLAIVRPRIAAIKQGENSAAAQRWKREFTRALQRRITLKVAGERSRKQCDSYLQRLGQFPRNTGSDYLRRFAQRGASTLN
jgi:hypothetical protein